MTPSRTPRPRPWLAFGLCAAGIAALVLLTRALASTSARGRALAAEVEAMAPAPEAPRPAVTAATAPARAEASAPAPARESLADEGLTERVRQATDALVLALDAPEFADEPWQAAVRSQAETIGPAGRPALRALLADETRSVEEHVAASELLEALEK